ncbi:hypothetical protein ACKVMT_12580 [Halobacteriales archaeon Cl-PHB]
MEQRVSPDQRDHRQGGGQERVTQPLRSTDLVDTQVGPAEQDRHPERWVEATEDGVVHLTGNPDRESLDEDVTTDLDDRCEEY